MLCRVGVSPTASQKWIPDKSNSRAGCVTSVCGHRDRPKPLIYEISHVGQKLCRQQLLPGKEFDVLSTKLIKDIEQSLQWHKISSAVTLSSTINRTKGVFLLGWCR